MYLIFLLDGEIRSIIFFIFNLLSIQTFYKIFPYFIVNENRSLKRKGKRKKKIIIFQF